MVNHEMIPVTFGGETRNVKAYKQTDGTWTVSGAFLCRSTKGTKLHRALAFVESTENGYAVVGCAPLLGAYMMVCGWASDVASDAEVMSRHIGG